MHDVRIFDRAFAIAAIGAVYGLSIGASDARAHFNLMQPLAMHEQGFLGDPQKTGPCGPGPLDPGIATNDVTTFEAGETITVQWAEAIQHPGHFRIALAKNPADLTDPDIDVDGNCNYSSFVDQSGIGPVLVDDITPGGAGVMVTQEVTLPSEPCENCTLQVIQFMTQHAPPCIYYHCANINVVAAGGEADAGVSADAGIAGTGGAGGAPMTGGTGGMSGAPITTGGVGGAAGTVAPVAGTTGGVGGAAGVSAGMVGAGTGAVAGSAGATGGAPASPNDESSGCRVAQSGSGVSTLGLLGLALLLVRRRRAIRA